MFFWGEVRCGCLSEGEGGGPGERVGAGEGELLGAELGHEEEAGAEVDC